MQDNKESSIQGTHDSPKTPNPTELTRSLRCLQVVCAVLVVIVIVMAATLGFLMSEQAKRIGATESRADLLHSEIEQSVNNLSAVVAYNIGEVATNIADLNTTMTQIELDRRNDLLTIQSHKTEITELESNNRNQTEIIQEHSSRITGFEEYLRRPSYAFNAYWLADTSPSKGEALVFTRAQLNEGNVYDSSSGKYTAPVNGAYLFSTTLCVTTGKYAYLHFMADYTLVGAFRAAGDNLCTSSTVTAFLQKDMEVWLKVYSLSSGQSFHNSENYRHSNFAGHLIKEV